MGKRNHNEKEHRERNCCNLDQKFTFSWIFLVHFRVICIKVEDENWPCIFSINNEFTLLTLSWNGYEELDNCKQTAEQTWNVSFFKHFLLTLSSSLPSVTHYSVVYDMASLTFRQLRCFPPFSPSYQSSLGKRNYISIWGNLFISSLSSSREIKPITMSMQLTKKVQINL